MSAVLDRIPSVIKVALWIGLAAAMDAVLHAVVTGTVAVDPVHVPIINIVLVAIRDFARSRKKDA